MSSASTNPKRKSYYDVFLSFCAKDADSFVSRIYDSLTSEAAGVVVFREGAITSSNLNIIDDCKIAIIVFSKNYAKSKSCVEELQKITEAGIIVLSLFYDGFFPFHDFDSKISIKEISQEKDKFMAWVAAITRTNHKALNYFGGLEFDLHQPIYRKNENEYIIQVVKCVKLVINQMSYIYADLCSKSVYHRAQDVIQLLKQSNHSLLLGIWGIGGIGKTTIAKYIFNQIGPYFEHKLFIEDINRDRDRRPGGVFFQQELLFNIDKSTKIKIRSIESGKVILKKSLQYKRILLVLDNVHKLDDLKALCGSPSWFGAGSKIIITTRDRYILNQHGLDHKYRVEDLDESESLELFNKIAFDSKSCQEDFAELSKQVIAYCGGWPLALIEVGHSLCGKKALHWEGLLRSLQRFSIPDSHQLGFLEKCLAYLPHENYLILLDIACFFIGRSLSDVLNRSPQYTTHQISFLEHKSYVTIDENNKLQMNILLQAKARDIIKSEPSNKINQPKIFDVFLSFRGGDSRVKFISHLYSSFQNAGIFPFRDDHEIERGDQITLALLKAIGQSRIAVVVLSTNYANSRWCMLELEKIMEVCRDRGLVVLPVFYEVHPSEVRHQEGQFGKAFEDLTSTISVDESTKSNWRGELFDVGGIAGFVIKDSRNESADIKNIVEHVTRLLDRKEIFVAEHPVGVESRVEAVTKLLSIQKSKDVLLLGIWGMGGMGKTTIAKAMYNQIGNKFDRRSFILNIREVWETDTNQVSLQQHILCDVYKTTTFKIRDIESGKSILKERLAQNKVLLVLDDVNELDQLKALCGSREWFGPGSRIVITTRDIHLLRSCKVDQVYAIKEMDESESLELFSWHAFKQPSPPEDFATHSTDVVAYSGRLPLALQVLGSYLSDCEITEWHKVLEKLKCIPHDQVQKKLKVSFDGLKDVTDREIFLDITCFFIGMDRNDAIQILNRCGFFADTGIKVLVERSLVIVDNRNKLRMHDLLRDMGRQIIYEESPFDPEKRSRLWRREEVFDVLSKQKGTEAVKGLALEFPIKNTVCLNTKTFKEMNKLRLLKLSGVQLNGDFKYLSKDLRWLYWHGFPSTYTTAEFQQRSLVAINLKYSNLKQIWKKSQMLENLKNLNLSHSLQLTSTPDFSYLPNLEKLVLKDCPSLSTVSHTIGSLRKILMINLTDCTGLQKLPRSIYKLKSLETLILSGCSKIDKLEEDMEQMESLTTLIADKTAITKVPFSIVRSKSIGYISLCGFEGFSRDVFPSLIRSWMSPSNNVISLVHTSASASSLGTLKDLLKLRILSVECGSDLQVTRDVARILDVFKATNCHQLEASDSATTSQISDMHPLNDDFLGQVHTSRSNNYLKSFLIQMGMKCKVPDISEENILQTTDGTWDSFLLSCDDTSNWLSFSCEGSSIVFDVPNKKGCNLKSMLLFVVYYSSLDDITSEGCQGVLIINYTEKTIQAYKRDTLTSFEDEDWQSITSNLEPGNEVEVMPVFGEGLIVEKIILSLLYDEPIKNEKDHCTASDEDVVIVSGHDSTNVGVSRANNIDVPVDNIVTSLGQDEHLHPMDKNPSADAMATKKKSACCFWWR